MEAFAGGFCVNQLGVLKRKRSPEAPGSAHKTQEIPEKNSNTNLFVNEFPI